MPPETLSGYLKALWHHSYGHSPAAGVHLRSEREYRNNKSRNKHRAQSRHIAPSPATLYDTPDGQATSLRWRVPLRWKTTPHGGLQMLPALLVLIRLLLRAAIVLNDPRAHHKSVLGWLEIGGSAWTSGGSDMYTIRWVAGLGGTMWAPETGLEPLKQYREIQSNASHQIIVTGILNASSDHQNHTGKGGGRLGP